MAEVITEPPVTNVGGSSGGIGAWIKDHKAAALVIGIGVLGLGVYLYTKNKNNQAASSNSPQVAPAATNPNTDEYSDQLLAALNQLPGELSANLAASNQQLESYIGSQVAGPLNTATSAAPPLSYKGPISGTILGYIPESPKGGVYYTSTGAIYTAGTGANYYGGVNPGGHRGSWGNQTIVSGTEAPGGGYELISKQGNVYKFGPESGEYNYWTSAPTNG